MSMLKGKIIFFVVGVSMMVSCSKESGEDIAKEQTTIKSYLATNKIAYEEVGDVYKAVSVKGYGYSPTDGDTVTFNYTIYKYDGSIVLNSNVEDTLVRNGFDLDVFKPGPTKVVIGKENLLTGFRDGLLAMNMGQVCDIYLTSNLMYGNKQFGIIPANSMLHIRMQILSVSGSKIIAEKQTLAAYIASQGITTVPQPEGYFSLNAVAGVGRNAIIGDTTYVSYVCKTLDGTIIEEIAESSNFSFRVGYGKAPIIAMDLAMYSMAAGSSMTIIVPSYLAYGIAGRNNLVQPYQSLIYDVNLHKINSKK